MDNIPIYLIAIPLAGAFLIPILNKFWKKLPDIVTGLVVAANLALALYLVLFLKTPSVYTFGNWPIPLGIVFTVDKLSVFILFVVALIEFFAYIFAIKYMDHFTGNGKFYTLYLLMLVGMNGVVMTGDLFNMFVFMEIASIASYALVAFGTEAEELEASFKYMVMGEIASLMILLAIAFIYAATGTLNLAHLTQAFAVMEKTTGFYFILVLLVFGFSLKAALAPFISWLPDAHPSAPAPVSSLLSGVFIKVLGIYALSRIIFNVYGFTPQSSPFVFNALIILGLASIIVGGLLALHQTGYKRLLADSTISQVGYIVLALGIGNEFALIGAMAHVLSHAIGKGLLFLTAGAVEYQVGERDLRKFSGGLGIQMPWTSFSYNLGALSIAGMPPFLGFFSKLFIILGALKAGKITPAIIAALFAVITLGYLLKIAKKVFWGKEGIGGIKEAPFGMVLSMICLVALLLGGGVFFFWVKDTLLLPASNVLLGGSEYARIVLEIGQNILTGGG